jgi:hypothetical protein
MSDEHMMNCTDGWTTLEMRRKDNHGGGAALSACVLTVAKSLLVAPKEDLTLSILRCARSWYRRSPPAEKPAAAPW